MYNISRFFSQAQEANEITQEDGRWFTFSASTTTLIILEKKDLAPHLAKLECVETVAPLKQVLRLLEDAGEAACAAVCLEPSLFFDHLSIELTPLDSMYMTYLSKVKLTLSHHTLKDDIISNSKPLVFVQDELKPPNVKEETEEKKKPKNKKTPGVTFKNFGAQLSTSAFKSCKEMEIAWRCRQR